METFPEKCIGAFLCFISKTSWKKNKLEEMLRQLRGSLSHHLQGFVHPRWVAGFLPSTVCLFHGDTFGTKRLGITKQWPLRSQNNQHDVMFEAWNIYVSVANFHAGKWKCAKNPFCYMQFAWKSTRWYKVETIGHTVAGWNHAKSKMLKSLVN